MNYVHERQAKGEVVTGLLYVDPEAQDLHEHFNTSRHAAQSDFDAKTLSPGKATLDKINASMR